MAAGDKCGIDCLMCGNEEACCNGTCCKARVPCCNGTCCAEGTICAGGKCCSPEHLCKDENGVLICCTGKDYCLFHACSH